MKLLFLLSQFLINMYNEQKTLTLEKKADRWPGCLVYWPCKGKDNITVEF